MVKLTAKYLFRKISRKNPLQPRKKDETDLDYLQRVTHLHLQSQFIDKISSVPECQSVSVIYLHNNLLRSIQNLENFPNLTHLYLQHNFISKIENLHKLTSLRKLYLGNNEISVVEGLENLVNLTELHVESQRLPQGGTLYFDPLTLSHLKNSLKILNVSNNKMSSMTCFSDLMSLTTLIIENNQIKDLDEVTVTLSRLPLLETLKSQGNPVASDRKFFDRVVFSSKSLKNLNGKRIDEQTRIFITNLEYRKACREKLSEFSTRVFKSNESFLGTRRPSQSLNQIVSRSSAHLGSKLFPVMKTVTDKKPKALQTPSLVSMLDARSSAIFRKSLKVSHLPDSETGYYYYELLKEENDNSGIFQILQQNVLIAASGSQSSFIKEVFTCLLKKKEPNPIRMDNYKKGKQVEDVMNKEKIPIPNLPEDFVWMQVSSGSKMKNLLQYAIDAMKDGKVVVWTGVGPSLGKAISCAEILKRKFNAHQISKICYNKIEDHWDPCIPQLEPLIVRRDIPTIHILISRQELDVNEPGYQAPGKCDAFWKSDQQHSGKFRPDNNRQTRRKANLLKKYSNQDDTKT